MTPLLLPEMYFIVSLEGDQRQGGKRRLVAQMILLLFKMNCQNIVIYCHWLIKKAESLMHKWLLFIMWFKWNASDLVQFNLDIMPSLQNRVSVTSIFFLKAAHQQFTASPFHFTLAAQCFLHVCTLRVSFWYRLTERFEYPYRTMETLFCLHNGVTITSQCLEALSIIIICYKVYVACA